MDAEMREFLREFKEDIYTRMDDKFAPVNQGISGINSRLDRLNGQTNDNSKDIAVLASRQQTVDATLAQCAARQAAAGSTSRADGGFISALGSRGWKTAGAALLLVAGALSALVHLVVELVHALLPSVKQ